MSISLQSFIFVVFCFNCFSAVFGQTIRLPSGYRSKCFNPVFEQRYNNLNNLAQLSFGVTVFVDERHKNQIHTRRIQVNILVSLKNVFF